MTDDVFASILDGVLSQSMVDDEGTVQFQYLQTLMYSSNYIGFESMKRLVKLIPNMVELVLNNIGFVGCKSSEGEHLSFQNILD